MVSTSVSCGNCTSASIRSLAVPSQELFGVEEAQVEEIGGFEVVAHALFVCLFNVRASPMVPAVHCDYVVFEYRNV